MTQEERRKEIIRLLQTQVSLETNKLASAFGISPVTVRRDFEYFEKQGFLTCTYGGAIVNHSLPKFTEKDLTPNGIIQEKRLIAKKAAELVHSGDTIILDAGSTVKELAIELLEKTDITVFTNSILSLNVLAQKDKSISLFTIPGQFRKNSMAFMGAMSASFLETVHVDYAFLGMTNVSYDNGYTIRDPEEVYIKRMMHKAAKKTVVLADHSKLGSSSLFTALSLSDVDLLITGSGNKEATDKLAQYCKEIEVVDTKQMRNRIDDMLI